MNYKNLTLNDLDIEEELLFFKKYYLYLLKFCQDNKLYYDGNIAVDIIVFGEDIDRLIENKNEIINDADMKLLIKIAEGRVFLKLNELSPAYNKNNSHDILKVPRYKMFYLLETHGY